ICLRAWGQSNLPDLNQPKLFCVMCMPVARWNYIFILGNFCFWHKAGCSLMMSAMSKKQKFAFVIIS
ncbi:hypothetical protein RSA47_12535, partial [Pantoea ananatis]